MKIIFAGTGSAFTMQNYQTNLVIQSNGKNLLFDCGGDARHSLADVGLKAGDISAVYASHLHADHIGGLEWLALCTKFGPKPHIKPVLAIHPSLVKRAWEILGGLRCLQDENATLSSFFDGMDSPAGGFAWEGILFGYVPTTHVFDGRDKVPSFGLCADDVATSSTVLITSDSVLCDGLSNEYAAADLIIHDCETSPFKSGVHAHYDDLKDLPADIKSKMLLVHYQDNVVRHWDQQGISISGVDFQWSQKAKADGFAQVGESYGFVPTGYELDVAEWLKLRNG